MDEYAALRDDPRRPLHNKVIQGRYPPASTFKLVVSAFAMERKVADLDTHMPIPCSGGMWVGNRYFKCWDRRGHGNVTMRGAIAKSCDVYFYQLGARLGIDALLESGVRVGLGERTGIDLPNEQRAIWPNDIRYFNEKYGARGWTRQSTVTNLSIGQGENSQTVANMARIYAALATDGSTPRLEIVASRPEREKVFDLTPEQLQSLRLAMLDVVSARGTAGRSAIAGINIAGKTGTAQTGRVGERDHAWFVGFAPAENPKIVVAVFVEHGEHGSDAAFHASRIIGAYLKSPTAPIPVTEEGN